MTLDPAGGTCTNHTTPFTLIFRGSTTLPDTTSCTRDGYVLLGWTRNPSLTTPEHLLTTVVARPGTLTAVWGALPTAPEQVDVIANLFCTQNCTTALILWPTNTTTSDTTLITVDNTTATCELTGDVFGFTWCWITGLTPTTTHTTSIAWRNTHGTGPATTTTFPLN